MVGLEYTPLTDRLLRAHMMKSFRMKALASMTDTTEIAMPLRQSEKRSPLEKQPP